MKTHTQDGFTLIELLVVIGIIAVLVGFSVTNLLGSRERARDVKKKAELSQLKTALRIYFNDYGVYPPANSGALEGCGTDGDAACSGNTFEAGASGSETVYMKRMPTGYTYTYARDATGDDFRLVVELDNISDSEILASQTRCPPLSGSYATNEYVICAD